jgi:hypothetical protein
MEVEKNEFHVPGGQEEVWFCVVGDGRVDLVKEDREDGGRGCHEIEGREGGEAIVEEGIYVSRVLMKKMCHRGAEGAQESFRNGSNPSLVVRKERKRKRSV